MAKLLNFYAFSWFSLLSINKYNKVEFINWLMKKFQALSYNLVTTCSSGGYPAEIYQIFTEYPPNGFTISRHDSESEAQNVLRQRRKVYFLLSGKAGKYRLHQ